MEQQMDVEKVRPIHTVDAPSHVGPVPQAVEAGGWIYVLALFGADPRRTRSRADARAEPEQLFNNLGAILAAAAADLTDVVRVGIVMRDLAARPPAVQPAVGPAVRRPPAGAVGDRVPASAARGRTPGS